MRAEIFIDTKESRKEMIDFARVLLVHDDGTKINRKVTIESLLNALVGSVKKKWEYSRIGQLPRGYYDGKIYRDKERLNAKIVTILPSGRQIMNYKGIQYEVGIPSLVFHFEIYNSRLNGTYVYSIKDDRPNDRTRLYYYPFGNVNPGDNRVCWGSNAFQALQDLNQLNEYVALFIQTPCNDDYYQAGASSTQETELQKLLETLEAYQEFPDEWLVETAGKKCLGNLLSE